MKTKRKNIAMVLVALFVFTLIPTAAVYANTVTATPTAANVIIDGTAVNFTAYNISGRNYFMLRDVAYALNGTESQFDVSWTGRINILLGREYSPVGGELSVGAATSRPASPVLVNLSLLQDAGEYWTDNTPRLTQIGRSLNLGGHIVTQPKNKQKKNTNIFHIQCREISARSCEENA